MLENTPDNLIERRFYKLEPYVNSKQISRLIYDTDVSLLLDITHAKIAAKFNGWNILEYIESLPLERVKEIHINGCEKNRNMFIDSHNKMEKEDYLLLEWVLKRTNPEIISLEYSGRKGEKEEDIEKNILDFFDFFK